MFIPFPSADSCASAEIVSSTSYKCPGGPEKSDKKDWCSTFAAKHLQSDEEEKRDGKKFANYWLSEDKKKGEGQGFVMNLGRSKTVRGVYLKNTHNAKYRDRSTKKFRILGSDTEDGPWQELLVAELEDSREQKPPPLQHLMFENSAAVSFIKFELLEYYGTGGGLQYFAVPGGFLRIWNFFLRIWPFFVTSSSGHKPFSGSAEDEDEDEDEDEGEGEGEDY